MSNKTALSDYILSLINDGATVYKEKTTKIDIRSYRIIKKDGTKYLLCSLHIGPFGLFQLESFKPNSKILSKVTHLPNVWDDYHKERLTDEG